MSCLTVFTVSSLLCGIAPSLGLLLFFRVLQGAGGGGLQPMAQAILDDTDTFMVLAAGSAIMFLLAVMLKKNDPGGGPTIVE